MSEIQEFGAPTNLRPIAGRVDPDLGDGAPPSFVDELAAELNAEPDLVDFIDLKVPGRERYAIRARLDFDGRDMERWRRAAKDSRYESGLDGVKLNILIVGQCTTAILRDGEPIELAGRTATFMSTDFQDTLHVQSVAEAVLKFYGGRAASITAASDAIYLAAGWGEKADEADPTATTTTGSRGR